jgi:PRTRC genetic system protein F
MRLPRLAREIPIESDNCWGPSWLAAAKSLHDRRLLSGSDLEGNKSPGKVVEAALSRWFGQRTAGVTALEFFISFAKVADLFQEGAIEEPDEEDMNDLAVWIEIDRDRPNFRRLCRGFEEMEAIAGGLGIAATTILSTSGSLIGFTFDHDFVSHCAGLYTYGWEDAWPDGKHDPSEFGEDNEDGSNEFFAYTRAAFERDCPRPELAWHPKIAEMEKFVMDVARRYAGQILPPLLDDLVALVKARRHRGAVWPALGGTDYNSMYPVFSLAWEDPSKEINGDRDNIYRVWDDYSNMLYNGAEGWTYGIGSEVLACRTPELLKGNLKRWDTRLRLLRATDRLLTSMTDPVDYGG